MQKTSPRMVRLDDASKEVDAIAERIIVLIPDEQLAFWTALNTPVKLTTAQKELGKLMRGEA